MKASPMNSEKQKLTDDIVNLVERFIADYTDIHWRYLNPLGVEKSAENCLDHLMEATDEPQALPLRECILLEHFKIKHQEELRPPYAGMPDSKLPRTYKRLLAAGIMLREDFFWVANHHPGLEEIFEKTEWAGGYWRHDLLRIKGATPGKTGRGFRGAGTQRFVQIPIERISY